MRPSVLPNQTGSGGPAWRAFYIPYSQAPCETGQWPIIRRCPCSPLKKPGAKMPAHLDNACQFRAWLQRKFIINKSSFSSPPSPSFSNVRKVQSMVEPVEETQTSGSCNLLPCKQFFARCVACLAPPGLLFCTQQRAQVRQGACAFDVQNDVK